MKVEAKYGREELIFSKEEQVDLGERIDLCLQDILSHNTQIGYAVWDENERPSCWAGELISEKIEGVVLRVTILLEDIPGKFSKGRWFRSGHILVTD